VSAGRSRALVHGSRPAARESVLKRADTGLAETPRSRDRVAAAPARAAATRRSRTAE